MSDPKTVHEMLAAPDFIWHSDAEAVSGLARLMEVAHFISRKKGWWDKWINARGRVEIGVDALLGRIMLVVTELAEASEAVRDGQQDLRFEHPDQGVKYALSHDWSELRNGFKPEGLPAELADAVIRIFDIARGLKIDLGYAIVVKMYHNQFRRHRHGGRLA